MAVEIPDVGRLAGDCGFDGTNWIKSALRLGYHDVVRELVTQTGVSAGNHTLSTTAVPVGEVHIIESIAVGDYHTDLAQIEVRLYDGASDYKIETVNPQGANYYVRIPGPFTLAAGEYIQAVFVNCILNDTINLAIVGRKIEVS